ncbi:MAG TPA: hypothetical protein VFR63_05040 [Gaiellaceae bacterium]|nr:hypothetical protein [Gaiellaceae bacterium]
MRFVGAVIATALALLFLLTALALGSSGQLRHPVRVTVALAALFVLGLALLLVD